MQFKTFIHLYEIRSRAHEVLKMNIHILVKFDNHTLYDFTISCARLSISCKWINVFNTVFRAHDLVFCVHDIRCRVQDSVFRAHDLEFRAYDFVFRAHELVFGSQDLLYLHGTYRSPYKWYPERIMISILCIYQMIHP